MTLYRRPRKVICPLGAVLVFAFIPMNKANGQTAESLSQVKSVFVDSLGPEEGATELREAMIKALRKNSDIQVVAAAREGDAVIRGSGKIWETGTMRVGPHGGVSQKTYDGYLQVELMGKGNKTLWSYRATPSKFPWNGIVWDLASHVVKYLMQALRQTRNAGPERVWLQGPVTNAQSNLEDSVSPDQSDYRTNTRLELYFYGWRVNQTVEWKCGSLEPYTVESMSRKIA